MSFEAVCSGSLKSAFSVAEIDEADDVGAWADILPEIDLPDAKHTVERRLDQLLTDNRLRPLDLRLGLIEHARF